MYFVSAPSFFVPVGYFEFELNPDMPFVLGNEMLCLHARTEAGSSWDQDGSFRRAEEGGIKWDTRARIE